MTNLASPSAKLLPSTLGRPDRTLACAAFAAAALLLGAGGCSDYSHQIASDVRANPTPELMTLWERPVDVDNHIAITRNTNFRSMWEDLGRAMLLDRPSPMTPEPMPR